MERIATAHLKRIGAWLEPPVGRPKSSDAEFPVECSVVIPVRNRVRTVGNAVESALSQQADFAFNVIVVDNHSTDGTSDVFENSLKKTNVSYILSQSDTDLGIGGCWNEAVYSKACGRYAVQLDSDDLYAGTDVLSRVVAEFRRGQYAVVIGSYTIVDFELKQIPPGLIDHREWTPENGHNNALRIQRSRCAASLSRSDFADDRLSECQLWRGLCRRTTALAANIRSAGFTSRFIGAAAGKAIAIMRCRSRRKTVMRSTKTDCDRSKSLPGNNDR